MEHEALTRAIIGCAMRVHRELGPGFLESVYQNALTWELRNAGMPVVCGARLDVRYRGVVVGEFVIDLLVGEAVLVENKAVRMVTPAHEAQLVNYLTATGVEVGLLLNFGAASLAFLRKTRTYRAPKGRSAGQDFQGLQD